MGLGYHDRAVLEALVKSERDLTEFIDAIEFQSRELPNLRRKRAWVRERLQLLREGQTEFRGLDLREMPEDNAAPPDSKFQLTPEPLAR